MKMKQLKNKFNLVLTALSVVGLIFASACGSDDPVAPKAVSIDFSSGTGSVMENGDPLTVTVNFSADSPIAGTFSATVTGDAVYTDDYTTSPAVADNAIAFTVAIGDSDASFTFTPVNNDAYTGDKTVTFTLSGVTGVDLGTTTAITVTIADDEVKPTDISTLRADYTANGETALTSGIIEGVITSARDNYTGKNIMVQDATGGIIVRFAEDNTEFEMGDQMRISLNGATLTAFGALIELDVVPLANATKIGTGTLPTPVSITIAQLLTHEFQGQIVTLSDVAFKGADGSGTYNGGQTIANVAGDEVATFVRSGALFSGDVLPAGVGTITGIASAFSDTPQLDLRTAGDVSVTASVTISTTAVTDFGNVTTNAVSASQSYTLSATGLLADVSISAPSNFEISLEAAANFGTSLTIPMATADGTSIFVRFAPTTGQAEAITGNVSNNSFGALGPNVAVSGTETVAVVTTVLIADDFDYGSTAGDLTTVSSGAWVAHSGAGSGPAGYITTSLSMTGYGSTGVGGSMTNDVANSEDINISYTERTSGNVYGSALMNFSAATTNGDYFFHLKDDGFGLYGRVYVKDDGAGNLVFGLREGSGTITGGSSPVITYSTTGTTFAKGTTYLLVVKYDFTAGSSSLYVLDNAATTEPTTAEVTVGDAKDATKLSSIGFRQGSNTPTFNADGIRVATDWAGVIGL
jgi:hypothetical protein